MREFEEIINEIDRMEKEAENAIKNHNNNSFAQRLYTQINILKWCLEPPNKKLKLTKCFDPPPSDITVICIKCLREGREPHRVLLRDAYVDITAGHANSPIFPDHYCVDCAYTHCTNMKHLKESEIARERELEELVK